MPTDMRSLSREAKFARRVTVIALRHAGGSYVQIALQVGLSRTGVFDICKRHAALGETALRDAPGGRSPGQGRTLAPAQELLLRQQIIDSTPGALAMPELLWSRAAVARLIKLRLGIVLPVRTLALYLHRWGFTARRPQDGPAGPQSLLLNQWLADRYPLILAKSKAEGGEINWGSDCRLRVESIHPPHGADAAAGASLRARKGRHGVSMLSVLTNKGQLRWATFHAPLDAHTLIAFLGCLIRGAGKKVFLITGDLRVHDDGQVRTWLLEHEDVIEAFDLPAPALSARHRPPA